MATLVTLVKTTIFIYANASYDFEIDLAGRDTVPQTWASNLMQET